MGYSGVFVFGDSLVDAGNALKLAQWYGNLTSSDLPDGAPTASAGYFNGRFTDGYTFADLLANKLIGSVTKPVFPFGYEDPWIGVPISPFAGDPAGNNLNFAYGGAQIRQGEEVVPDFDGQTDAFKNAVDNRADPNALYVFTFGGNDIRSLVPDNSNPVTATSAHHVLQLAAEKMLTELTQLVEIGARHIVITGIPDVGLVPDYDKNDNLLLDSNPGIDIDGNGQVDNYEAVDITGDGIADLGEAGRAAVASEYSAFLDALVRSYVVTGLEAFAAARGIAIDVTYVQVGDIEDESGNVVTPGALSLNLPTLAATNGLTLADLTTGLLQNQDVLFFDDLHPSAQAHALLGAFMYAQATGTPWIEVLPLADEALNFTSAGVISVAGEVDKLVVSLVAGTTYTIEMLGISSALGSLGDGSLRILGPTGTLVSGFLPHSGNDSGAGFDATFTFTAASSGNYTVELTGVGMLTGSYVVQAGVVGGAAMLQNNNYVVSSAATGVIERVGGGFDTVSSSVSYALAAGSEIELLQTTNAKGKGNLNLTGNEFGQKIIGNAGANIIDGKAGEDVLTGGAGKDTFILSGKGVDQITDYAAGEVIDITQLLKVAAGTNVVGQGWLRVTTDGRLEVDTDGGGNNWVTVSTVSGTSAVTVRYLSGTTPTTVNVSRVTDTTAARTASFDGALAGAVAATGLMSSSSTADAEGSSFTGAAQTNGVVGKELAQGSLAAIGRTAEFEGASVFGEIRAEHVYARDAHDGRDSFEPVATFGGMGRAEIQSQPMAELPAGTRIADYVAPAFGGDFAEGAVNAELLQLALQGIANLPPPGLAADIGAAGDGRRVAEVGRILADALDGNALPVDALLSALAGGGMPEGHALSTIEPSWAATPFAAVGDFATWQMEALIVHQNSGATF